MTTPPQGLSDADADYMREIHVAGVARRWCAECEQRYPCTTIRALDDLIATRAALAEARRVIAEACIAMEELICDGDSRLVGAYMFAAMQFSELKWLPEVDPAKIGKREKQHAALRALVALSTHAEGEQP